MTVKAANRRCPKRGFQTDLVPEEHAIKVFAANSAKEPFNERVRHGYIGDRVDFIALEHAQDGEPAVKAEEGAVVSAEVSRARLAGDGMVEHPAHGYAVDVIAGDAKAYDSSRDDVHDHEHPEAAKQDRAKGAVPGTARPLVNGRSRAASPSVVPPVATIGNRQACGDVSVISLISS